MISESTLSAWCNQGATSTSAGTYASIKKALGDHNWPAGMSHEVYLQGSYANSTNIRGDSDVDIVVESDGVFYNNLTDEEKQILKLSTGAYGYSEFRAEVAKALADYYDAGAVDNTGDKCIKVDGASNRLPADVVPSITYKSYKNLAVVAKGIMLITNSGKRIVNYPKIHRDNGTNKNQLTYSAFKPSVRMFKNARNHMSSNPTASNAPSYFVECLIYNVPNELLQGSRQEVFVKSLSFLAKFADAGGLANVLAQNEQHLLFGSDSTQWDLDDALSYVEGCLDLWNNS